MGGAAKAVSLVRGFEELGMEVVIIGTQTEMRRLQEDKLHSQGRHCDHR